MISRGDAVTVSEEGIRPWTGMVLSVKPGRKTDYADVRNEEGIVWVVPVRMLEKVER